MRGLSPPVRGSLPCTRSGTDRRRSIPARAGEPYSGSNTRSIYTVYPRPCGGATVVFASSQIIEGLSPPVRGSPWRPRCTARASRSIPARAGEPSPWTRQGLRWRVYPRPCGGAIVGSLTAEHVHGLSPPVRGSPANGPLETARLRSIPARAGEPAPTGFPLSRGQVYPRPCGGAFQSRKLVTCGLGLSPPVRGSRAPDDPGSGCERSIPARAGEPKRPEYGDSNRKVYPRPCGGASMIPVMASSNAGLSPPVRGSHSKMMGQPKRIWSIPARAGEPSPPTMAGISTAVYPRPCGGASCAVTLVLAAAGLSPPVRGSRPTRR